MDLLLHRCQSGAGRMQKDGERCWAMSLRNPVHCNRAAASCLPALVRYVLQGTRDSQSPIRAAPACRPNPLTLRRSRESCCLTAAFSALPSATLPLHVSNAQRCTLPLKWPTARSARWRLCASAAASSRQAASARASLRCCMRCRTASALLLCSLREARLPLQALQADQRERCCSRVVAAASSMRLRFCRGACCRQASNTCREREGGVPCER